jgi:predicted amidohydrolase YtcJ
LETGKLADMIVLDQNLFDVDPERIRDTNVILTMVDGKIVYEK